MARFEVLAGKHVEKNGERFGKGDVVETSLDLIAMFGEAKFKRLTDVDSLDFPKSSKKFIKRKDPEPAAVPKDARGEDVTASFKLSKAAQGLRIFARGDLHHIYDGNSTKPENEKGLKQEKVLGWVKDYLSN